MDRKTNQQFDTVHGPTGLPLIGNLPQLLPNPLPRIQRWQARYGNVFYAGFAGNLRSVFLLGPDATKLALVDKEKSFSARLGYQGTSKFIGEGAILFRDGEDHLRLRRAMNGAFKPLVLDQYLKTMSSHVRDQMERFSEGDIDHEFDREFNCDIEFDIRLMSLKIASEVIAGARFDQNAGFINQHFTQMLKGMTSIAPSFPGSSAWKGSRSKKRLGNHFRRQILERRKSTSPDLFTQICHIAEKIELGEYDVRDNMLAILVAAYETSASAIAMMLYELARHPEWQDRLGQESSDRLGAFDEIHREDLEALTEMEWVMKETLRLHTPISFFPRRTTEPIKVEGHTLPPNTQITLSPAFTHRMPSIYPDPKKFDPLRFSPARVEDKIHPCAWMPFGKGPHTCMGMNFARLEIKLFFAHFLRDFRVELTSNKAPLMIHVPVLRPKRGLPIRVFRRSRRLVDRQQREARSYRV